MLVLELGLAEHGDEADVGGVAADADLHRFGGIGHAGRVDQMPCPAARDRRVGKEHFGHGMEVGRVDAGGVAADVARRDRRSARQRDQHVRVVAADSAPLDEAVERAYTVVAQNDDARPESMLAEEDRRNVAERIGIGAIKYADLSHNRTSDYVFSYDKMLAMTGNTATYMQYSYARVKSIFAKGQVSGVGGSLGELLDALVANVPDVRFRLSSVEATEVDETLERLMVDAPRRVAAHLHAPLQSGSDRILKRMGRHWYTARSYRERIEQLVERVAPFGLGADVIAGFPGETDDDHAATLALVEALPFTYLHVFPYSPRPDVAAGRLPGAVPPELVNERASELRGLGERKAAAHYASRRGARADGVVSGRHEGRLEVLTQDYLTVYYPSDQWDLRPRFEVTIA